MTTTMRIKRKAESPRDAIVLATKRARATDTESEPAQKFTFQCAGTIDTHGDVEAAIQQVKEASHRGTDREIHPVDLPSKLKDRHRPTRKEDRLSLPMQHRVMLEEVCSGEITEENVDSPRESAHGLLRLYDVVDEEISMDTTENEQTKDGTSEVSCSDIPVTRETVKKTLVGGDYVYDVYFNIHCDFTGEDDFILLCCPPDAFARHRTTTYDSDTDSDVFVREDSDDSNAEVCWSNDYPDEEHHLREEPELDDAFLEQFDTFYEPSG